MDREEFFYFRSKLNKTQKQLAHLLGASMKAVHSYEQGWRKVPAHVERQLFFLVSRMRGSNQNHKSCWILKECPPKRRKQCPAWEYRAGKFCWFINGTICEGDAQKDWDEKMKICRKCDVLISLLEA